MTANTKIRLNRFRMAFFREKYRFDQGNSFLAFVNFSLLVIGLVKSSGGNQSMIPTYVAIGFVGTWFLGYFLDKVVRIQEAQERVSLKRSPLWQDNFDHHGEHNKKLEMAYEKILLIEETLLSEMRKDKEFLKTDK